MSDTINVLDSGSNTVSIIKPYPLGRQHFSGFDELSQVGAIPSIQHTFHNEYLDNNFFEKEETTSGNVYLKDSMLFCKSEALASTYGRVRTKKHIRYRAGQSIITRFTTMFSSNSGVAGIVEGVGIGDRANGFGIGYFGTSFGLIHATTATAQIAISSLTQTDGTATATTSAAHGLTTGDYVSIRNIDTDEYIKIAQVTVTGGSTFTYAVDSSAASPAANFSSVKTMYCTKVSLTCTDISSFSEDKLDGTGNESFTLDKTKINVWELKVPYLGGGDIELCCMIQGKLKVVHRLDYVNLNTFPSIANPGLPVFVMCENTTNTTSRWVGTASVGFFLNASHLVDIGREDFISAAITSVPDITTEKAILTIRNKRVFQGTLNTGRIKINSIEIGTEGTGTNPIKLYLRKGATVAGAGTYTSNGTTSIAEYELTNGTITDNNLSKRSLRATRDLTESKDLTKNPIFIEPEEYLVISAFSATNITTLDVTVNFTELKE